MGTHCVPVEGHLCFRNMVRITTHAKTLPPFWLKWLKRFVQTSHLDAYHPSVAEFARCKGVNYSQKCLHFPTAANYAALPVNIPSLPLQAKKTNHSAYVAVPGMKKSQDPVAINFAVQFHAKPSLTSIDLAGIS